MTFVVHGVTRAGGKPHARQVGEYLNFNEAVAAAKREIDDFLYREYKRAVWHGVSAKDLFQLYKRAGEAMLVVPKSSNSTVVQQFDHLKYATRKCEEICANVRPPATAAPKAK